MDFDKFSENGKKIKLTEEKKTEIINICKEKKAREPVRIFGDFKRVAAVACALIIALSAVIICKNRNNFDGVPVYSSQKESIVQQIETAISGAVKTTAVQTSREVKSTTEVAETGCAELLPGKYRNNYYSVPASFSKIVGREVYLEWEDKYLTENYPDDSNEMVMVAYVKAFDISKEDFERANLEYAKFIDDTYSHICLNPQDYADQEMQEIYNADIIYTFDNEVINEYYLGIDYPFLNEYQYVEALEAGTYKTRTTQFITVEQMEAEIIAKYGEAEIVTEAETTAEGETENAESSEITEAPVKNTAKQHN